MKILLDGHGGDNAPLENVLGAIDTVNQYKDLEIVIVGKPQEINPILKENYNGNRISVIEATEIINNDDIPTRAIKEKKDSSMVKGLTLLKEDNSYDGMVSAGSTGALLTGGLLICKRIKGISRPALVPLGPTVVPGKTIALVDCGANAECKPMHLCHFALMGSAFMRAMYNIEKPIVALLNNGMEEGKGNELTKQAYPMIKSMPDINFMGNIEARDLLFGIADVIVTDGFSGNIALKSSEGMAKAIFKLLKDGIKEGGIRGKLGAIMIKPILKNIKKLMDVNQQAGGTFLGIEKIIVKAHGSSTRTSIKACIEQAMTLIKADVINKIKIGLSQMPSFEGAENE